MDTPPIPVNPPQTGFVPSASTVGTSIGGALATIIIAIVDTHWHVSAEVGAAIAVLCSAIAGYLPSSGRR